MNSENAGLDLALVLDYNPSYLLGCWILLHEVRSALRSRLHPLTLRSRPHSFEVSE